MKAYQCSECANLCDYDESCNCSTGIDPRHNHREKGDAELCRQNFKKIEKKKHWHEKFAWE